jgi:hypothetical protein
MPGRLLSRGDWRRRSLLSESEEYGCEQKRKISDQDEKECGWKRKMSD